MPADKPAPEAAAASTHQRSRTVAAGTRTTRASASVPQDAPEATAAAAGSRSREASPVRAQAKRRAVTASILPQDFAVRPTRNAITSLTRIAARDVTDGPVADGETSPRRVRTHPMAAWPAHSGGDNRPHR